MKTTKTIYLIPVLAFLLVMLQRAWFADNTTTTTPPTVQVQQPAKISGLGKINAFKPEDDISVTTDMFTVNISTQGGAVIGAHLTDYPQSLTDNAPFTMLSNKTSHLFVAQTGMSGDADLRFSTERKNYVMQPGQDQLSVTLYARDGFGKLFSKTYSFQRGRYHVDIKSTIENRSRTTWAGMHYSRFILRHDSDTDLPAKNIPIDLDAPKPGWFTFSTYTGPAYFTENKPYVKLPFADIERKPLRKDIEGSGWIAMQQRYFITAFVPQKKANQTVTATWQRGTADQESTGYRNLFNFSTVGQKVTLAPGESVSASSQLYIGPEKAKLLAPLAKGLELTVDYGWLWFISDLLFQGLVFIHSYLGSWGWSIIMITLIVKLMFYKLSEASYKAMAKQKKLQPQVNKINEEHKDNAEARSSALIALYQKENINPVSGCLPQLLQIPFFIALYYVLIESVALRFQPFLWLPDLSSADPFFVLPVLFCLSMFAMQMISPPPQQAEGQGNPMMFMPLFVSIMMAQMPAGLLIYSLTNNVLSLMQQWFVNQHYR
jgi:YidC/Oxa1 family membrane protein insertase